MAEPFSLPHFREWASELVLDTGDPWVLEEFQADFLEDVFAGFAECWLVVPECNTKTTLVAGLALYHVEHTASAWATAAASSREQAQVLYRQAQGFVLRTPGMRDRFKLNPGLRRITSERGYGLSQLQFFAADDRTGDGIVPTLCVLDELHRHKDLRLYRTWRGKLNKRDGQIVAISTAGEPGSEFEETRERIRQQATDAIRKETFVRAASERLVLHEWAVPEAGDVEDLELVKRANPFSGITLEGLREKRASPTMTLTHWRRFVCNLPTRSESAAITEAEWADAASEERIPEGAPVSVGLDVGWKWDTTAIVPLWWRDDDFRLLGPAVELVPPRDGRSLDPDLVERALIDLHQRNPVHTVVMDMSRAEQLAAWIEKQLGAVVVDRSQGNAAAAEDYERFMEALRTGRLRHSGDQVLTRHVMNGVARVLPYGDARFDRPAPGRLGEQRARVIDALIAAAMVHAVAGRLPQESGLVMA